MGLFGFLDRNEKENIVPTFSVPKPTITKPTQNIFAGVGSVAQPIANKPITAAPQLPKPKFPTQYAQNIFKNSGTQLPIQQTKQAIGGAAKNIGNLLGYSAEKIGGGVSNLLDKFGNVTGVPKVEQKTSVADDIFNTAMGMAGGGFAIALPGFTAGLAVAEQSPLTKPLLNKVAELTLGASYIMDDSGFGRVLGKLGVSPETRLEFFNFLANAVLFERAARGVRWVSEKLPSFTTELVARETLLGNYETDIGLIFGKDYKGPQPSAEMIRSQALRLAKMAHPDKGGDIKLFQEVMAARDRLLDAPNRMMEVDAKIMEQVKTNSTDLKFRETIEVMKDAFTRLNKRALEPKPAYVDMGVFMGKSPAEKPLNEDIKFSEYKPAEYKQEQKAVKSVEATAPVNFADMANAKSYELAQKKVAKEDYLKLTDAEISLFEPEMQQTLLAERDTQLYKEMERQANKDNESLRLYRETVKEMLKLEEQERKLANLTPEKARLEYMGIEKARNRLMEQMQEDGLAQDTNTATDLYDRMANEKPIEPKPRGAREQVDNVKIVGQKGNYFPVVDGVRQNKSYTTRQEALMAGSIVLKEAEVKRKLLEKGIGQKKTKQPPKLTPNQYDALSQVERDKYKQDRKDYKKGEKKVEKKGLIKKKELTVAEKARLKGITKYEYDQQLAKQEKAKAREKRKLLRKEFDESPKLAYPLAKETAISKLFPLLFYEGNKAGLEGVKAYEGEIAEPKPISNMVEDVTRTFKKIAVPLSTQIRDISPKLADLYEKTEFKASNLSMKRDKEAKDGLKLMRKVAKNKTDRDNLTIALANADDIGLRTIRTLSKKYPGLEQQIEYIRAKVLKQAYSESERVGFDIHEIKAYRPTKIRDSLGLFEAIERRVGPEKRTLVERAIAEREKKLRLPAGTLPIEERVKVVNSMMRGYYNENLNIGSPHFRKRKLIQMDKELAQYYYGPADALKMYIKELPIKLYFKEMFGGDHKNMEVLTESLGAKILETAKETGMTIKEQQKLKELFQARLSYKGTSSIVSVIKNITYMLTLANPISTLTQLGDLLFSFYESGTKMTMKAILGPKYVNMEDVGILSYVIDMVDNKLGRDVLDTSLKAVGFENFDRFGKEVMINSTLYKFADRAKNEPIKAKAELEANVSDIDTADVIKRLEKVHELLYNPPKRNGMSRKKYNKQMSDAIKEQLSEDLSMLLWKHVAKYHPIYEGRMTPLYLTANGWTRLLYQLKTFNIASLDGIVNTMRKEFRKAETATDKAERVRYRVRGVQNLVKIVILLTLANYGIRELKDALKSLLNGKKKESSKLLADAALSIIGLSTYDFGEPAFGSTRLEDLLAGQIMPSSMSVMGRHIDTVLYIMKQIYAGESIKPKELSALRNLPFVGDLVYQAGSRKKEESVFDKKDIFKKKKDIFKKKDVFSK